MTENRECCESCKTTFKEILQWMMIPKQYEQPLSTEQLDKIDPGRITDVKTVLNAFMSNEEVLTIFQTTLDGMKREHSNEDPSKIDDMMNIIRSQLGY